MKQTSLALTYETGLLCSHCGKDPGASDGVVWNGFRDMDNNQLCCNDCRNEHYAKKMKTEHRYRYSEFPVVVPTEKYRNKLSK